MDSLVKIFSLVKVENNNVKLCLPLAVILWNCHFILTARDNINENINICEHVADHIFIQDIQDCTKYFVCIDGQAEAQQCRAGLYFDAKQQACIGSRQGCLQCPPKQLLNVPLIKTCDKYISCYYGHKLLQKCKNHQQFNVKTGKCDVARNVDCVDNRCSIHNTDNKLVYVPSAASCGSYYICIADQPKSLTCAPGLYFSTQCNCCDTAENVQCLIEDIEFSAENVKDKRYLNKYLKKLHPPTFVSETTAVKCPPNGHFIYQYIEDPEYYVTCVNGKAALYACATGYQFDDRQKRCVNKDKLEQHTSHNLDSELSTESPFMQCPEFGAAIIPHAENNKYILCFNGNASVFNCPEEQYFDAAGNVCRNSSETLGASNIICPKSGTFIYPHAQPNRYYVCIDGNAIGFVCAEGHIFDTKTNACQRDNAATENNEDQVPVVLDEPINILCPSMGAMKFAHEEKNKFYLCVNGMASLLACAKGSFFDAVTGACRRTFLLENTTNENVTNPLEYISNTTLETEPNLIVKCPMSGTFIYPHAEKNQYYVCLEGKPIVLTCSEGLHFDIKEKTCRAPIQNKQVENQPPPIVLNEIVSIMCPASGAYKFPHIEKNKFYLCINGMGSVLACSNGSIFNKETRSCRTNEHETTAQNSTLQFAADVSLNNTGETINIICPAFGTFLYPHGDKHRYFVCLDGSEIEFTCAEGFIFDTKTNVCIKDSTKVLYNVECPSQGTVMLPHGESHKFYLCINGTASIQSCAAGDFFDVETKTCSDTSNAKQISITCPELGTFVYPLPQKNTFYVCHDGRARVVFCAAGDVFDAELNACREIYENPTVSDPVNYLGNQENPGIIQENKDTNKTIEAEIQPTAEEFSKDTVEENTSETENILLNNNEAEINNGNNFDNSEKNPSETDNIFLDNTNQEFSNLKSDIVEAEINNDNILDNAENNSLEEPQTTNS